MFENLSERLERSFKILKGQGKITELNVAETLKEVRRSLLDADVNYKNSEGLHQSGERESFGYECTHGCQTGTNDGEDCPRRVG